MSDFYCSEVSIYVEENCCFFCNYRKGNSTAIATLEELRNVRAVYNIPAANANTQTTNEDFILLGSIREASTQTAEECFKFFERTKEVGTQTTDEDFIHLEPTREVSTEGTNENFIYLEPTQKTGTLTTDEDFILLEPIGEERIQTAKEDNAPYELISDSNTQSTKEDFNLLESTRRTSSQTIYTDFILRKHVRFERTLSSVGNLNSIKASDINKIPKTSADTNEIISITWIKYNNGCCIGNVNLTNFLSRREVPTTVNAPRFQKIPNDIQKAYKVPQINKKRNVPNRQRITMKAPFVKRSKYNSHGTSNPVLSRKNVQDSVKHLYSKANQKPSDNIILVGTRQKSLTNKQENRQLKTIGNLTGNKFVTIPNFQKYALNKIASLTHQNKYAPSKFSYSEWSAEGMDSVFDTSEVTDLTYFHENKRILNLLENKFQPEFLSEDEPLSSEQKKQPLCVICKKLYTEKERVKDLPRSSRTIPQKIPPSTKDLPQQSYICRYTSSRKSDQQFPTYIQHPEEFRINTCGEVFTENDFQGTERTCGMCFEVFQSESLLEKHALVHEDYNLSHCRVCKWKMSAHIAEYKGKRRYQCCGCSYRTNHVKYLNQHLSTHVGLQVFRCYACDSSFSKKKNLERHFKTTHKRSCE